MGISDKSKFPSFKDATQQIAGSVAVYANNVCMPVAPADSKAASLPVVDFDSFNDGIIPKNNSAFSMARIYENPDIIAIDASKDMAATIFGRMSYFVERTGRKNIPSLSACPDGVCNRGMGYDVKMEDVAAFFTICVKQSLKLNVFESAFLEKLLALGLLAREGETYIPLQDVALIGISNDVDSAQRTETFEHEYAHGRYFTDLSFRKKVDLVWEDLAPSDQQFIRGALIASGYYASGESWLIKTEAHAHAIEDMWAGGGFTNILLSAQSNCFNKTAVKGCGDFLSFRGDIKALLADLHTVYSKIPLTTDTIDGHSKCFADGTYMEVLGGALTIGRSLDVFFCSSPSSRYEAIPVRCRVNTVLDDLQSMFDARHKMP